MAYNDCQDGCFDESVQLQQGPTGAAGTDGADGADGTDGVDGVAILYQSTAINSPTTISSTYSNAISSISIPADTLETVGDMLRLELLVQNDNINDNATIAADTFFSLEVELDSNIAFDNVVGYADIFTYMHTGSIVVLDLVVTATDTIQPRLVGFKFGIGSRVSQYFWEQGSMLGGTSIPPLDDTGNEISNISADLSTNLNLDIKLKNSDGLSTSVASVTSATIYKYLKS